MLCHAQPAKSSEALARLASLKKDTPIIPEKPLYKLPDFVIFSHARHKSETISCDSCHGDVWANDAAELQLHMKMKACVDCHKANRVIVTCTVCHELSQ